MANETGARDDKAGGKAALKVLAPGQEVERAAVAPDGTVTIAHGKAKLESVDIADVDLLLSFSDGSYVIIPNGALDALGAEAHTVVFTDGKSSLAQVFKMAGQANPAKAGSLRLVSENIDAAKPPADEAPPEETPAIEPPAPPAPMTKVGTGTTLMGKGPGLGGSGYGEGEGEVPATVVPLMTPNPPVFRVGQRTQTVEDLLSGTGLGQPNFTHALYTSSNFKVAPSGRADLPLGAYDPVADTTQLAVRANPLNQATREIIQGTGGADTIDFNPAFSAAELQWTKTLHLSINNFSDLTSIQLVFNAAKIAMIPGFDIQGIGGAVVTRDAPGSNSWHVTPDPNMLLQGLDLAIVYQVHDSALPVDFGADVIINGHAGPFAFEVTNNLNFTWRDAVSEADFTVFSSTGDPLMVLPRAGVGVEIFAGNGDDIVNAGSGPDLVHGQDGNDTLGGGLGNDILDGGLGADALDGGPGGIDTATYETAVTGVTANLNPLLAGSPANTNEAAGDTYASIENLTGSDFNDTLLGNSGANVLTGRDGDDMLLGGDSNDTLDGGGGTDTASYEYATSAVTVSLTSNAGTLGEAFGDVLVSIENLIGGAGNDTFTGAAGIQANAFDGRGGTGDTVSYAPSTSGVVATLDPTLLLAPLAQTNDAMGDTFLNIENLTGSAFADTLVGSGVANILVGGAGNDLLEGLGGADTFTGGADTDTVSYANSTLGVVSSLTTVFAIGPAVTQTNDALGDTYSSIENMAGSGATDTLIGNSSNNQIDGGAGDDILEGMDGADALIGGAGIDTASYVHAEGYVMASLTTGLSGFANQGHASGDTYDSIEYLTGSDFGDTLIGNVGDNILTGGAGDDILEGMGGADQLVGGTGVNTVSHEHSADQGAGMGVTASLLAPAGNTGDAAGDTYSNIQNLIGSAFDDTLTGDGNANILTGGAGNDSLSGGAGQDTLYGDAGNDSLTDDLVGAARLYAGSGDDQITLTNYDNIAGMQDAIDGGTGTDTLIWGFSGSVRLDFNMWNGTFSNSTFTSIENITIAGANSSYIYLDNNDNIIVGGSTASDYVDYRYATGGISANLQTGVVTGGSGNDTLSGIEHLYAGTQWDDVLIGNGADNWIRGYYGNDTIDGAGGNDTWYIDWSGNAVTASLLSATQNAALGIVMTGDAAGDTVTSMENIYATYSTAGYTLFGNAVANRLEGQGNLEGFIGADTLVARGATATASYVNAGDAYLAGQGITTATGTGVIATLTTIFAVGPAVINTGDAAGDIYSSINHLTGSAFADTLIGNGSINVLTGGAGDDILEGLSGGDTFLGGAGNDTASFAHSTAGVLVDLQNRGIYTATNDAVGDSYNSIENFIGSNFNDTVYGTSSDNILIGGGGNDTLNGDAGFDTASYADATGAVTINLATNTVTGSGIGTDTLVSIERIIGSSFADTITGSGLDDLIDGGAGADTIDGAAGSDTVSYASATGGRSVNLATGVNTDNDVYTSIENILGSAYGDILAGNGGDNIIEGGLGDDTLEGGGNTAAGDTASYAGASAAVNVSLANPGAQATGGAGTDTLSNFENLLGSNFNDTLTGDAVANVLNGGDGDDTLVGGAGADTLIGGLGTDTVSYATAGAGVTVIINGAGSAGDATGDVLSSIENLVGSGFDDTLTGDGGTNLIIGGAGSDTLNGQGGIDTVSYAGAAGAITITLASIAPQVTGGSGTDTLSNFENIIGSGFADNLTGDGSANTIEGGAGADILVGGGGNDTASYAGSSAGVTVSLTSGTGVGGDAAGDTLSAFSNLTGSALNDTLTGNLNANTLDGGAGDDILIGGAGADALIGGTGINTASYAGAASAVSASLTTGTGTLGDANGDTFSGIQNLTGSDNNDTLTGDANANILVGGLGNDTLSAGNGNDTLDVRLGRDTAAGGNDDDIFWVDSVGGANLPTLVNGDANTAWTSGGGDSIRLFNLVNGGSYSLTSLANVTANMEILDIRDGLSTTLNLASLDVRNFADGGNGSQIWIKANSGDTINVSGGLVAGETFTQTSGVAGTTDYTIYNAGVQVAQIHWQIA